jgi:hypothetical protein
MDSRQVTSFLTGGHLLLSDTPYTASSSVGFRLSL